MNDTPTLGGRVAFVTSDAVSDALDQAAGSNGETPSAYARRALVAHLITAGHLAAEAPTTTHQAWRYRGRRRARAA